MNDIYIQTKSTEEWKSLLADPEKQWKTGYSAKSLSYAWEETEGFPKRILKAFKDSNLELEMLLGIPEYKVYLDTKKAPSQNDLFVLAKEKNGSELVSIMIEGKVSEPFDILVKEWFNGTKSRENRLNYLLKELNINKSIEEIGEYRYQLFHRTVSAIKTAKKFNAKKALMIVHSFSQKNEWFEDYSKFLKLLIPTIETVEINKVYKCFTLENDIELSVGWIKGDEKFLNK
jgi:hypothetical protein